jgi:hypothetical protein
MRQTEFNTTEIEKENELNKPAAATATGTAAPATPKVKRHRKTHADVMREQRDKLQEKVDSVLSKVAKERAEIVRLNECIAILEKPLPETQQQQVKK